MNWFLTLEALPEDMHEVLLFHGESCRTIGYYNRELNFFIREYDGSRLENVTHWMPLPEAPQINIAVSA
jgi:hypothetical protein